MSNASKEKETSKTGWSADALIELSDLANEQLRTLERLDCDHVLSNAQQELQSWHTAALARLGQIYTQRLADLAQVYAQDVCPDADKFKQKMIEQLKTRVLPRIAAILDDPSPDQDKVEKMHTVLCHIKSEHNMMRNRQWIRVQLPDIKSLSIPIKISKTQLATHLATHGKDLLDDWSDDDETSDGSPTKKKRKAASTDPVDIFALNPEPMRNYSLDTNSSTLALSNTHILVLDSHKLLLFDYVKQVNELPWNDNDYGILVDMCWMPALSVFVILTIHSLFLFDPNKPAASPPVKVDAVKPLDRSHVFASVCPFERDVYINYHKGVHIDQYRIAGTSEWTLEKRHSKGDCVDAKDIGVRDIRCDAQNICLSVMQQGDLKWRLDIVSRDLKPIRRGVPMDSGENQHKFFSMLVALHDQRWLFVNWYTNKLWLVDQQGNAKLMKESKIKNVRNVCISPSGGYLAVRTERPSALKLYKLE